MGVPPGIEHCHDLPLCLSFSTIRHCTEFPFFIGPSELSDGKLSIEDKVFNSRTSYLSFQCETVCTFP